MEGGGGKLLLSPLSEGKELLLPPFGLGGGGTIKKKRKKRGDGDSQPAKKRGREKRATLFLSCVGKGGKTKRKRRGQNTGRSKGKAGCKPLPSRSRMPVPKKEGREGKKRAMTICSHGGGPFVKRERHMSFLPSSSQTEKRGKILSNPLISLRVGKVYFLTPFK